jgi:hypothetical protein
MSGYLSFLARLTLLALGCGLLLRAGRLEAAGHLIQARRVARQGGFLGVLGSLVAAAGAPRLAPAMLLLASGFAALLAGLSGKPRPTGWAAFALLVAGAVVALFAVR